MGRCKPARALARPGQLHARGADDRGRERLVRLECRERLNRLAETLLVGDERAPSLERVAHARALEGVELATERETLELGVLGVGERDDLLRALVLGRQLV